MIKIKELKEIMDDRDIIKVETYLEDKNLVVYYVYDERYDFPLKKTINVHELNYNLNLKGKQQIEIKGR